MLAPPRSLRPLFTTTIVAVLLGMPICEARATDPCLANRAGAAGRKAADLLRAFGRYRKTPDLTRLTADRAKAQLRLERSWNRGAGDGSCADSPALDEISRFIDRRALDLASEVAGIPKVLVIGLDGAGWEYLDPLRAAGFVPALDTVISAGTRAPLDCETANPAFSCYCPMVWSSIATGQPASVHGMVANESEPQDRGVPAIWTVLHASGGSSTLVDYHNTYPPEPEPRFVVTSSGVVGLAAERFTTWGQTGGETGDPASWTSPPLLFESLGLLPYIGPTPDAWDPFARDRTSALSLGRLIEQHGPSNLTMWMMVSTDKTEHLTCGTVVAEYGGPVDETALLSQAAGWSGPIEGPFPMWGDPATQYLESDAHVASVLSKGTWDYVMLLSDHSLTLDPENALPCHHVRPAAWDGIFSITGPGVLADTVAARTNVLCVAPLLAYVLDIPIAQDLPCVAGGAFDRLIEDVFTTEHLAANPPRYIPTW